MINADKHKKLLEQITELEHNSVNYFDVEKEFFLIDSDNLANVKTKLYGYSIQCTGIYEDDDLTAEAIAGLDGRGCYVYVEVKDDNITIKQDFNGSWGIYLFRHGDYFALSNSFFRLLDRVKFKYPLTINRDYCHFLLLNGFCSFAYSETAVNEIQLVERNAILCIDIAKKQLKINMIDYRENTIPLDSEKGIAILDSWIEFWSNILRDVAQHTKFIQADLSGGFDSRIAFIIALNSGINLDEIQIFSHESSLHTYAEDYKIASQIAEHYSFKLNKPLPSNRLFNVSFSDSWNTHLYSKQTVHTGFMVFQKPVNKCYKLTGYGGEMIRDYWLSYTSLEKWYQGMLNFHKRNHHFLSDEIDHCMETIIKSGLHKARDKYKIEEQNSLYVLQYFYNEGRGRHHFGKVSLGSYFRNEIIISPILDPLIRSVKINTSECLDHKLLVIFLLTRYAPDLLTFPFDSKHFIAPETIEYAKKINERFPRRPKDFATTTGRKYFHLQPRDLQVEKILSMGKNNPRIPDNLKFPACLKSMFESSRTHGLFTTYFDSDFYNYATSYYDTQVYYRFKFMDIVVGITKALEDVEISQCNNHPPYQDMRRFLEQDFCRINTYDETILSKFKDFFSARVTIRLDEEMNEDSLHIVSCSDERAEFSKPEYWAQKGVCHSITSYAGQLEIVAKVAVDKKAQIRLSGKLRLLVDYTKLTVNGKIIFDTIKSAGHFKPYVYNMDVKAGEEIKLSVEWQPHRQET